MPDYIPQGDAEFNDWFNTFYTSVSGDLAGWDMVAAELVPITNAKNKWDTDYSAHKAEVEIAKGKRETKDNSKDAAQDVVRPFVRAKQENSAVLPETKLAGGVPVRDTTRSPIPAPTTPPVITRVDTSQRLRHIIHWSDSTTPTSKAKPSGAHGAEIRVKIGGPPPTGPDECEFIALDTATPHLIEFDAADAGKTAHYMLRWVNAKGDPGPWSATVSATIGA